jgi:hypothetical protein
MSDLQRWKPTAGDVNKIKMLRQALFELDKILFMGICRPEDRLKACANVVTQALAQDKKE